MKFITKIIREYLDVTFSEDFALYGALWYWPLFLMLGFNTAVTIIAIGLPLGAMIACGQTIIMEWPGDESLMGE